MLGVSYSSLSNRISRIEQQVSVFDARHICINDDHSFVTFNAAGEIQKRYIPSPSGLKFHASNDYVRNIMGPFGSGKSTTSISDLVMRASKMPKCIDNIRRSKWLVMRNTSGELETSTLETWRQWFGDLGEINKRKKPVLTWEHRFNDGNGVIEMVLVYLAVDRPEDFGKLKSTEFTGAYLNEASELPDGVLDFVKGRVTGRYPSKAICPHDYWYGVIMDTNPPNTDHWIYKIFEVEKPNDYSLFKQPAGLLIDPENPEKYIANPDAENVGIGIPADYYLKVATGADKEFVKVYCMGQYGLLKHGEVVYPQYNDNLHATPRIEIDSKHPIYLGWDFGNTPACLIAQHIDGQVRLIKEFVSKFNTSVAELCEHYVKPWLDQNCKGMIIYSDHDPSDPHASSTGIAPSQVIESVLHIKSQGAVSNLLQPRLDAVKFFLNRLTEGKPAYIISLDGCPTLRAGMYGKYIYRLVHRYGEKMPAKEPDKTHPISDIQDAQQYICLRLHDSLNTPKIDLSHFISQRTVGEKNAIW